MKIRQRVSITITNLTLCDRCCPSLDKDPSKGHVLKVLSWDRCCWGDEIISICGLQRGRTSGHWGCVLEGRSCGTWSLPLVSCCHRGSSFLSHYSSPGYTVPHHRPIGSDCEELRDKMSLFLLIISALLQWWNSKASNCSVHCRGTNGNKDELFCGDILFMI